jgi:hypothetical protein
MPQSAQPRRQTFEITSEAGTISTNGCCILTSNGEAGRAICSLVLSDVSLLCSGG